MNGQLVTRLFDELPRDVPENNYICSDSFEISILDSILFSQSSYGLLVIERGRAAIGTLESGIIRCIAEVESNVMGKSKAGGQSAKRFERERERQKNEFFKEVAEIANRELVDNVEGFVIGGTDITIDEFLNGDYLHYQLRDSILGKYKVDHATEQGLDELSSKSKDVVEESELVEEIDLMKEFYKGLRNDEEVAYGNQEIEKALGYGAVDTILLSEELHSEEINEYRDRALEYGSDVKIISSSFDKGYSLANTFDGVAALLRFPIN